MARHPARTWPRLVGALILGACVMSGCAPSTVVGTSATPASTSTATPTAVPTTCRQLSGFATATALAPAHMQLPDNTVAGPPATTGGGPGQFTVQDYYACAPNSTTDLTVNTGKGPEAFTHLLLFFGWAPSPIFPADSELQSPCGSAACDVSTYLGSADDPITQNYLELKSMTDQGHGLITFHLLLATPPAKPPCRVPIFDSNPHPYITAFGSSLQLPPLTREGTSDGHAGSVTHFFCSAGTAATVSAFMASAIPAGGYASDTSFGAGCWKIVTNGLTYRLCLAPVTDPSDWTITTYVPM